MSSPDQATEKKDVAATATPPADPPEAPDAPAEKEEAKEAQSGDANEEAKGNICYQRPFVFPTCHINFLSRHFNRNKQSQPPTHVAPTRLYYCDTSCFLQS